MPKKYNWSTITKIVDRFNFVSGEKSCGDKFMSTEITLTVYVCAEQHKFLLRTLMVILWKGLMLWIGDPTCFNWLFNLKTQWKNWKGSRLSDHYTVVFTVISHEMPGVLKCFLCGLSAAILIWKTHLNFSNSLNTCNLITMTKSL